MSYHGQQTISGDPSTTAKQRYEEMKSERDPYLLRARDNSRLTIASLFRNEGDGGATQTDLPWQSFGAYCVNNLSSKLTVTIIPPGISPIRLDPSRETIQALAELGADEDRKGELKVQIQKGLRASEQEFTDGITQDMDSTVIAKGMRYLLVGGDHGFHMYKDGTWRGIPLDCYTVLRDGQGNLLEFVIEDSLVWETLPKSMRNYLEAVRPTEKDPANGSTRFAQKIELYTHGRLNEEGKYELYQEACGYKIPDTEWTWAKEYLPYVFVPFNLLPKEHYGRSYVEDYLADIQSLDGAEEILIEGTAAGALLIRMVKPGGVTSKEALARARNGAVITGDGSDVSVLQANKTADLQALERRVISREGRLAQAFLLDSSVQRDAERVTAEEIRVVAASLSQQLGSIYLELVGTLQKPWARLKMAALMRTKRMTPLPPKQVNVQMATGAAALSRDAALARLDALTMPPNPKMQEVVASHINGRIYTQQRAIGLGVDQDGLIKSQEMLDAEAAQQAQMMQMEKLGPPGIKAGADLLGKGIDHRSNMEQIAAEQSAEQAQPQGTP